jgi:outer membrane protein
MRTVLVILTLVATSGASIGLAQSAGQPPGPSGPPPVLSALVRDAATRNLTIAAASFTPEIAAADIRAAKGAFDAQLQLQPGFGRSSQTIVTADGLLASSVTTTTLSGGAGGLLPYSGVTVVGNLPTGTQYGVTLDSARQSARPVLALGQVSPAQFDNTLTLSLSQPLLRGAGSRIARAGIRSATVATQSSRAGLTRVVDTTVADVESAYWTAVYARALEKVAEESLARANTLLDRNRQLLSLQLVANIDLLTARQGVAVRQAELTEARRQRADAVDALAFVVFGRDAAARLNDSIDLDSVPLPEHVPVLPSAEAAQADALRERPDLREAELDLDRSGIDVEVARDGLRPSLNLTGSYTAFTDNVSSLRPFGANRIGDAATAGWQGGVLLTIPVRNNVAKAAFQQASLVQQQQETSLAAIQNQVRQDVRQALRAIEMSGVRVGQTTEALQLAVEEYEAENQRLQLGLSDSFRLLQFEDHINDAQQTQLDARFSLAQALVSFDLARGASAAKYGVAPPSAPAVEERRR